MAHSPELLRCRQPARTSYDASRRFKSQEGHPVHFDLQHPDDSAGVAAGRYRDTVAGAGAAGNLQPYNLHPVPHRETNRGPEIFGPGG